MENIIELDKVNEVYFQIRNIDRSTALELREHFSCFVDNYFFHPKYRAKLWDGRISFYDWNNQTIPIGLFPQFVKFCKKFGYEYHTTFNRDEIINEISDEEFDNFYENIFKDSSFEPREFQDDAIKKALRMKRGVIESPTASGKSLILYSIIRFILGVFDDKKILLIVPNINLVNQIFTDFIDYGWKESESFCALIFNKSKRIDFNKQIIISTFQSLVKKDSKFLEQFGAVIVDETHTAFCKSINTILKKCINAEYRIGVTGTITESLISQFTIYGYLGPKIFSLTSSELIDKGFLSKIKIANLIINYPKKLIYDFWHDEENCIKKIDYNEELDLIFNFTERNNIFKYIITNIKPEDNILILCHKIDHLKIIKKYLEENFKDYDIFEIYGKINAEDREKIRKLASIQGKTIILGTYATLSTGWNLKRLHHIIFASSTRSKIRLLQSIGRGLRLHETKNRVIIWDITDKLVFENDWNGKIVQHNNHTFKHFLQRLQYYKMQNFKYVNRNINISELISYKE